MAPTGLDIWRPLIQKLRSIARNPAGTVKPTCTGGRADSKDLSADFTWEGDIPPRPTGYMTEHLPPLPAPSIALHLKLDGAKVLYHISIHIGPWNATHQAALYKGADTDRLESLVAHLRELAKWL